MVAVNEIIRLITLRNFNRQKYANILLDYQNNKLVCFFFRARHGEWCSGAPCPRLP